MVEGDVVDYETSRASSNLAVVSKSPRLIVDAGEDGVSLDPSKLAKLGGAKSARPGAST